MRKRQEGIRIEPTRKTHQLTFVVQLEPLQLAVKTQCWEKALITWAWIVWETFMCIYNTRSKELKAGEKYCCVEVWCNCYYVGSLAHEETKDIETMMSLHELVKAKKPKGMDRRKRLRGN